MSFLRHGEIYHCGEGAIPQDHALAHRNDESPAGYSSAGCSPAEPASASPASAILLRWFSLAKVFAANGKLSLILLSQLRGAVHTKSPETPHPAHCSLHPLQRSRSTRFNSWRCWPAGYLLGSRRCWQTSKASALSRLKIASRCSSPQVRTRQPLVGLAGSEARQTPRCFCRSRDHG